MLPRATVQRPKDALGSLPRSEGQSFKEFTAQCKYNTLESDPRFHHLASHRNTYFATYKHIKSFQEEKKAISTKYKVQTKVSLIPLNATSLANSLKLMRMWQPH